MPNLVDVSYEQTGKSTSINELGMREMQARAYASRDAQYLLLKAPPASGKSRALMFIALDKLINQGLKKAIVAVPEKSIGGSFDTTDLMSYGFFANWEVAPHCNLCTPGGDRSKVKAFQNFMTSDDQILICTHATLRFAYEAVEDQGFNNILLAIDEFHHVSADIETNRLGDLLRGIMSQSSAHVVAMTGSYFRGDSVPVLLPEDEVKFTPVTYDYYEQLNGYTYLKSLGIGYHFYDGKYTEAISDVLDTDKKTILHIPHVQSAEALKDKYLEVGEIIDSFGDVLQTDPATGITHVKRRSDGKIIKVADLVEDNFDHRIKIVETLRKIEHPDDMDLIIALGMAKEGFDWKFCEHALTVGYRSSLTEVIQIIGRCTRDSPNKIHAQFTNLIAMPNVELDDLKVPVNNMLKAITCSLLMEQVLAPNFNFRSRRSREDVSEGNDIVVDGFREPSTQKVLDITNSDLNDLKANILQDPEMLKAMPGNVDPEVINKVMIPKIIRQKYPDLNEDEVEEVRQQLVLDSVVKNAEIKDTGDQRFIRMADKFINIDELHIDLIDRVNPFQKAFEVLSKSVTTKVLKQIQSAIAITRIEVTEEEAVLMWPKVKAFYQQHNREPDLNSIRTDERRLAEVLHYVRQQKRQQQHV